MLCVSCPADVGQHTSLSQGPARSWLAEPTHQIHQGLLEPVSSGGGLLGGHQGSGSLLFYVSLGPQHPGSEVLGSIPVASTLGLSPSLACCGFHLLISKTRMV